MQLHVRRRFHGRGKVNTTAKHLRMHQVEHFWSLFQSHFSVRLKSPAHAQFHAAPVFDYIVLIEIAFMHNQPQITKIINRLDSQKGKLIITCVILADLSAR